MQISKVVKQILIANILIFFIGIFLQSIGFPFYDVFALHPISDPNFQIYQFLTHMFLHGGVIHILFNMLAFYSFGSQIEYHFGSKKFLIFYLLSGLGASFLHLFMSSTGGAMVGASGAIFGVISVFSVMYPNEKMYLFGFIGLKSKYLFSIIIIVEAYLAFSSAGDGIGHFDHLGGAITGLAFYYIDKLIPKRKKAWS